MGEIADAMIEAEMAGYDPEYWWMHELEEDYEEPSFIKRELPIEKIVNQGVKDKAKFLGRRLATEEKDEYIQKKTIRLKIRQERIYREAELGRRLTLKEKHKFAKEMRKKLK